MNWLFKISNYIPVKIKGKLLNLDRDSFEKLIKQKLLSSQVILKTFKEFDVNKEYLKNLRIIVVPLKDMYAETDLKTMKINSSLLKSNDFFADYFFVIAHEIVHWLTRIKEAEGYLNDPEERLGFCLSIAYELEQGIDIAKVRKKILPKLEWHFNSKEKAARFFEDLTLKAQFLLN